MKINLQPLGIDQILTTANPTVGGHAEKWTIVFDYRAQHLADVPRGGRKDLMNK